MTPNEYRQKYRRCGTCVYWDELVYTGDNVGNCKVKNKRKWNTNGRFCRVYKAKEFEVSEIGSVNKIKMPKTKPSR